MPLTSSEQKLVLKNLDILTKSFNKLKEYNDFLIRQQAELKAMAEKAGSEKAEYQVKCMLQEEEIEKLNNELKNLKVIKNGRK